MADRIRGAAQGFDSNAEAYEAARPSYPAEAVAHVVGHGRIGPGGRVLDLAAGTGKLTRLLVPTGAEVVAVEPTAAMRDVLRARLPDIEVHDGTAEDLPLADSSVDAVTVAQGFHWFETARALDEIARVLRPRGWLALLWHEPPRSGWAAEHWQLRQRLTGFSGDYPGRGWEAVLDADRRFGARTVTTVVATVTTTAEAELAESASRSYVHALDAEHRRRVLDELAAFLARHPDTRGGGQLTYERPCSLHLCPLLT